MPIYRAQSKGRMYIGASEVKEAYQGAKNVYKKGIVEVSYSYKNAPPFLSVGWKTLSPNKLSGSDRGWGLGYDADKREIYIAVARSLDSEGTKFISETDITIVINLTVTDLGNPPTEAYLVHSPMFEIGNLTGATFATENFYGTPDASTPVTRYSNNGAEWTNWYYGSSSFDKTYKYAQVGYWIATDANTTNPDQPGWSPYQGFGVKINSCVFS